MPAWARLDTVCSVQRLEVGGFLFGPRLPTLVVKGICVFSGGTLGYNGLELAVSQDTAAKGGDFPCRLDTGILNRNPYIIGAIPYLWRPFAA